MSDSPGPGRPSLYKPEYCQLLIDHMSQGLSFESFCAVVEVSKETLYTWSETHEEFLDAKKAAFQKCRLFWEKLGIEHIINKSDSSRDSEGNTYTSSRSLNSSVWIYNMKCRFRDEWNDSKDIKVSGAPIQIKIDNDDEKL